MFFFIPNLHILIFRNDYTKSLWDLRFLFPHVSTFEAIEFSQTYIINKLGWIISCFGSRCKNSISLISTFELLSNVLLPFKSFPLFHCVRNCVWKTCKLLFYILVFTFLQAGNPRPHDCQPCARSKLIHISNSTQNIVNFL